MFRNIFSFLQYSKFQRCCYTLRNTRSFSNKHDFAFSEEVSNALSANLPIVALESAVITHGMPYPHNLHTAIDVESTIREKGAIPATIAVLDGKVHIGLTKNELSFLAETKEKVKISRRDFPYILSKKLHGGTTVAGTMVLAHLCGIKVFVTGGIGGVHRGADITMDVSADLTELGRTPVAVICAGVKSILDVPKTLEYLETQGVCVCVLGPNKKFPDFFTNDCGVETTCNAMTPADAADMILASDAVGLTSGLLFAAPIPPSQQADGVEIKAAIETAVAEAQSAGVSGKEVTPYILNRVLDLTDGRSLMSNIALLKNNASIGASIAVQYCKRKSTTFRNESTSDSTPDVSKHSSSTPVVIGGSICDMVVKVSEPKLSLNGATHRGRITYSYGGVGRNLADALAVLGLPPLFISAVADDPQGTSLLKHNPQMNIRGITKIPGAASASYSALLDHTGEVILGVGDMEIHKQITPNLIGTFREDISLAPLVIMDGNIELGAMLEVMRLCAHGSIPLWFEPTDVHKAIKPWIAISPARVDSITYISPNLNELYSIVNHLSGGDMKQPPVYMKRGDLISPEFLKDLVGICRQYLPDLQGILVTLGIHGFIFICPEIPDFDAPRWQFDREKPNVDDAAQRSGTNDFVGLFFPAPHESSIASVSGAGDCLAAGFIAGMLRGKSIRECAATGMSYASQSLRMKEAVPHIDRNIILRTQTIPYQLIK